MGSAQLLDVVLGTHTVGDASVMPGVIHFDKKEDVLALLDAFSARGYNQIDTASNYAGSENRLGAAGGPSRFTTHTKIFGMGNGTLAPAQIRDSLDKSLQDLKVSSVETVFFHVPDRETPFEDSAKAMNEAWQLGKFKRFGLSNYKASEVKQFLDICEERGYQKPSVYQGHYNAAVRGAEKELIPLLRKNGMSYFAFSPAAGGLFSSVPSKTARWSNDNMIGQIYNSTYGNPAVKTAIETVVSLASNHGIDGHSAALRWTRFHSALSAEHGDVLIFGVSRIEQLGKTLDALEAGPLPEELAQAFNDVYKTYEGNGEPPYHA